MTFLWIYLAYAIALNVVLSRRGPAAERPPSRTAARTASRILVVGATGGTGRALVQEALDRQYVVTALVRTPERLNVAHARLTIIQGDVLDQPTVNAAMRGQDAVLSCLGHRRYFYPTRILSEGTRNLLRAMEAHDAGRFVCQTSLGIGSSAGRMGLYYSLFVIPVVLPFYFWDKTRQERLIAQSRIAWTIVRPVALTDGPARTNCRHGRNVGSFLWTRRIARIDVARFMLDQLIDDRYVGVAVGVSS